MNEPKAYTNTEGGHWLPWSAGPVDGRSLRQRSKTEGAVYINEIRLHSLKMEDGREWDCINGWRSEATGPVLNGDTSREPEEVLPSKGSLITPEQYVAKVERIGYPGPFVSCPEMAQAYAMRVWEGQSVSADREWRIQRVKDALAGQNLPFEGVVLP